MHSYTDIWAGGRQLKIATSLLIAEVARQGCLVAPMVVVMYSTDDYAPYSLITWEH